MSVLILCLIFSVVLIYLSKIPVIVAIKNQKLKYNNHNPRSQQAMLTGMGARAVSGHQNAFEAFPLFATAVLLCIVTNNMSNGVQALAIYYVISRVVYHALFLMGKDSLRSLVWLTGVATILIMMGSCL